MKGALCIAIALVLLGAFWGCEDEEKIIGCRLYSHVYKDIVGAGTELDTVYLFFAAGQPEEFGAPLTFALIEADSYTDSLVMELSVYGVSPTKTPEPFCEIEWRSDTLLVWYSGVSPRFEYIDVPLERVSATPPCPMPYYRIDHVIVLHPPGVVVYPHEDILH